MLILRDVALQTSISHSNTIETIFACIESFIANVEKDTLESSWYILEENLRLHQKGFL